MQLLTADKEAFGAVHGYALARLGLVGKSVASGRHAPGPDVRVHGDDNRGMLAVRISSPGGSGTATLARVGDSSAFVCSTLDGNAFARRVLAPFIRSLYPGISSTFLGCGEIRDAVAGTGQAGIDVRDAPAGRSGRPADKVAFRITEPAKPVIDGYVSRDGTMGVMGALGPFEGAVLRLADLAEKKASMYAGRSRQENGGNIRPLAICMDGKPFKDPKQRSRLVSALRSLDHASLSLYQTNPHTHAFVVDFLDGSSFDIWRLSDGEIIVVPQIRASAASVGRIIGHIMRRLGEGSVREYEV